MSPHPPVFTLHRRTASSSLLDAFANHSPSGCSCESGGSSQRNDAPPPQQPSTSPTATVLRSACRLGVVTRHRPLKASSPSIACVSWMLPEFLDVGVEGRSGDANSGSRSVSRCASATGRGRRPECVDRGRGLCSSPLSVVVRRTSHRSGCLGQGHVVIATRGAGLESAQRRIALGFPQRGGLSFGGSLCGRSVIVRSPRGIADRPVYQSNGTKSFSMKVPSTFN